MPVSFDPSEDYDVYAHEAQRIIHQLVEQSLAHVHEAQPEESTDLNANEELNIERGRFIVSENVPKNQERVSIHWPTSVEFTDENIGLEKINEYIEKEWKTSTGGQDPCWLYAIDFLERKSLEFTDLYIYQVRYSVPTRRKPIPQETVSVYFTFDVSKIKPKNTPVYVSFVFETMRVTYHPDTFRFRQSFLQDIILLKAKMAENIDF